MRPDIELNDAAVVAALRRLRELTGGQRTGLMQAIARYMLTAAELRFRRQVGPDGAAWVRSRRAQREGGQTLRDTGRLRASLVWHASPREAVVGTNVVYAPVHQFGINEVVSVRPHRRQVRSSNRARGTVAVKVVPVRGHTRRMFFPARPFLGFSQGDRQEILDILRAGITHLLRK